MGDLRVRYGERREKRPDLSSCRGGARRGGQGRALRDESLDAESLSAGASRAPTAPQAHPPAPGAAARRSAQRRCSAGAAMLKVAYGLISVHGGGVGSPAPGTTETSFHYDHAIYFKLIKRYFIIRHLFVFYVRGYERRVSENNKIKKYIKPL